ncbi:MAG: acyl-CoA dehydrogenase [Acidimicrobiia bacterium]|nr:acyl-CoA dehydrogenase [Acidimicrobiia bacterium]
MPARGESRVETAGRDAAAVVIESPGGAPVDIDELGKWIGRSESYTDRVTPTPVAALAATLDRDDPLPALGDPLPPLWHWLYFLPLHPARDIGPDGHAKRGGFLPPVPLPRRMFAGGRYRFDRPLRVGDAITRVSRIVDVRAKDGRSGPLVFVIVRHEVSSEGELALVEEHDIVYRDHARLETVAGPAGARASAQAARAVATDTPARTAEDAAAWRERVCADDVLLFRYSALTFNGHRIHYDRRYATEVEGYPGLVVHGPLIATLLVDLLRRRMPGVDIAEFSFRAVSPLFDVEPFFLCGEPRNATGVRLWATDAAGRLAMDASATLR